MNQTSQVNEILNRIASLSLDEQSYVADVVSHRLHEIQRNRLIHRVEEAESALARNKVMTGGLDDFFAAL